MNETTVASIYVIYKTHTKTLNIPPIPDIDIHGIKFCQRVEELRKVWSDDSHAFETSPTGSFEIWNDIKDISVQGNILLLTDYFKQIPFNCSIFF